VPIYEKGYKDEPANIAKEALQEARNKNIDVVLIDTAGRMQGNEKLMRQLAKLVHVNSPDVVLFVGEALVGNDSIDQLTKFNQSLIDFAVN
jgi:signal recognition particle receptor subunit alpha